MKNSIRIKSITSNQNAEIALVEFDMENEKVNKFSTPMMLRLREVIAELKTSRYKAAIFISRKPKIFIAGADIQEIKSMNQKDEFEKAVAMGQTIFNELEDLPMPTIAAIAGACAGGGCEFILACDYRIASEDNSTKIGLPETKLGIIPGFGGCIRMPRMIGLQNAMEMILAGKLVPAAKALKMGLVDQVVYPTILEEQAIKWAKEIVNEGAQKRKKYFKAQGLPTKFLESFLGRGVVYSQSSKGVLKMTHGHYPAPLKAIEVIRQTYGMSDRDAALTIERNMFIEAALTDVSKNLIHVFDLTEMVKKQSGVSDKSVTARDVKGLGILGAGTMGGGIAFIAADKGVEARMKDLNFEAIGKGLKHARDI